MRSLFFTAALAASVSSSAVGLAQPSKPAPTPTQSDAKTDQARELHIKGAAFYEQGQYDKAEAAFLAAWALKKHYQIASNLGACEMKLGKYADAAEHLGFFLREQPATGNKDDRVHTQALFDEARAKVGAVRIKVNVPGAVVSLGGREIGAAPLPAEVYLEPGSHTIEATHGGYNDARQVVETKPGGTGMVTLELKLPTGAPVASVGHPPTTLPPPPGPKIAWIVAGGALAAGGLAAGIGFTLAANSKSTSAISLGTQVGGRSACFGQVAPGVAENCTALNEALAGKDRFSSVALVSFVVGGAFALGTAGLAVWSASTPKDPARVQVAPVVGFGLGGLAVAGSW